MRGTRSMQSEPRRASMRRHQVRSCPGDIHREPGWVAIVAVAALLVSVIAACGSPSSPSGPTAPVVSASAAPSASAKVTPSASALARRLKAAGLHIEGLIVYSAATDPNHLLDRQGEYISKVAWQDPAAIKAGAGNRRPIRAASNSAAALRCSPVSPRRRGVLPICKDSRLHWAMGTTTCLGLRSYGCRTS